MAENFENNTSGQSNNEFKPFAKDPAKQKRYEQYLVCVKNGRGKIALPILQPKNMPGWFTFSQKFDLKLNRLFYDWIVIEFDVL